MSDEHWADVDAYIASLEDASGIVEVIAERFGVPHCGQCGDSGYLTSLDGRAFGVCSRCCPETQGETSE